MKINCLIVDDEPLARKGMTEYVKEVDFLHLTGECDSAATAAGMLAKNPVDLLLLDVQMPRLSGIDFLKTLSNPPLVIITSAFSEYALEGYELEVIDYLVKPIPFDRFRKAVNKVHDFLQLKSQAGELKQAQEYFFVKSNGRYERVFIDDILYVEAMQNYIIIAVPGQKWIVYMTLTHMEAQLPPHKFMKVHKSYIAALSHVASVDGNELLIGGNRIPVSRTLKAELLERLLKNNLLKR